MAPGGLASVSGAGDSDVGTRPPGSSALGGALVPAGVFLAVAWGEPAASGWGIPMATDPAFAVGVLALVARRIPARVRLLLLAVFEQLAQQDPGRYAFYALMNSMSGDLGRACAQVDPPIVTMRANGEVSALLKVLRPRAFATFWLGEWDGTWRLATEGLEIARLAGQALSRSFSLDLLGEIAALRGDQAACLQYVARAATGRRRCARARAGRSWSLDRAARTWPGPLRASSGPTG